MGYQEGYLSGIWQGISNLVGLAGLFFIVHFNAGLPYLILVVTGSSFFGNILNGISLFIFQRPWLIPKIHEANIKDARQILGVGFLFLILQITNAVNYSSDNLIIAKLLGPENVTYYAVPSKLFALVPLLIYMVLAPLWPAYGEANARGDQTWAKSTFKKSVFTTLVICSMSSLFFIVFGRYILKMWVNTEVVFSLSIMIGLGVWTTLQSILSSIALFLNAINKIRFQTIFALSTALFATLVKIKLTNSVGIPGVIWGNILTSTIFMLLPYTLYLTKSYFRA